MKGNIPTSELPDTLAKSLIFLYSPFYETLVNELTNFPENSFIFPGAVYYRTGCSADVQDGFEINV